MTNPTTLAERYVQLWNETDDARRRLQIAALWLPDGRHYVGSRQVQGHAALEQRVLGSHQKNVRDGGYRFRGAGDAQALHDGLLFHWHMVRPGSERIEALGLEFLLLAADGRIAVDYQFILPTPAILTSGVMAAAR